MARAIEQGQKAICVISNPKNSKSKIRAQVRDDLKRLSTEERVSASVRACDLLKQQAVWRNARTVLFYAPRSDELDALLLWPDAFAERKIVALPRYSLETGEYVAGQLLDAKQALAPGKFGILEPPGDWPVLPLNQLDLVLVPGVAFDLSGRRLGRGRGFYDRLLAKVRGIKCGIAFDQQIQRELPAESHDVSLNCLLTPTRWLTFGQRSVVK